ncbi:MAG: 4Fe-4S cluster-binding domain-containing protein [Coriobacteriia bacterium]|nr:4Fe-4S cluster-binding domain-containing protein [Coriobacteriia bacterium]
MSGNPFHSRSAAFRDSGCTPRRVGYVSDVSRLEHIPIDERRRLEAVTERFNFRASEYYLGLIDWSDPDDPIRTLVVPREAELSEVGSLDASNEASNTVIPGVQHKYADTALVLCVEACGGYCRYCFRKRIFMRDSHEATRDFGPALTYIADRSEITDVLLTGGDPLLLSTPRLARLLRSLRDIPHVRTVRIGTKMLAFNPYRLLDDLDLQELLVEQSGSGGRVYLMCHFDHPRELTEPATEAVDLAVRLGVICANQCPIIAGVNDDANVLRELLETTASAGCPQYYFFQCRPTRGNETFSVPLVRGWELFSEARRGVSGLARRARFCMSHETGKIEVVGVDDNNIYLRYHRAKDPSDHDRFMVYKRDDTAVWLDELTPVS